VDFWRISGRIDTCSKDIRDPIFLAFLEELTLVQKYQETQVTQEFLVYNDYFYFK
jgi:hypothetical protein